MLIAVPIRHRSGGVVFCSHCKKEQVELIGLSATEYLTCKRRLDDGLIDFEERYFTEKYMVCTNCGNICESFLEDNVSYFERPEIQEILQSRKPQIEKNFLIMHIIKNNYESLLDLYHLYQFLENEEETRYWRNALFSYCEDYFNKTNSIYYLRIMIELHRRNGNFAEALSLIHEEYEKVKNQSLNNDFSRYSMTMAEHRYIEIEEKLCKNKNGDIGAFLPSGRRLL